MANSSASKSFGDQFTEISWNALNGNQFNQSRSKKEDGGTNKYLLRSLNKFDEKKLSRNREYSANENISLNDNLLLDKHIACLQNLSIAEGGGSKSSEKSGNHVTKSGVSRNKSNVPRTTRIINRNQPPKCTRSEAKPPSYIRPSVSTSGVISGNNLKSSGKKRQKSKSKNNFEGLISHEEALKGHEEGSLIKGELRINPKNSTESYITPTDGSQDVLVVGVADRNRALDGDVVLVQTKEVDQWRRKLRDGTFQRTGKVRYILELVNKRSIIGLMQRYDDTYALIRPRDCRLPKLLVALSTLADDIRNDIDHYADVYFKAQIVCWNSPKLALGLIECKIGKRGDIASETEAILRELDLDPAPVPDHLEQYLPNIPFTITEEEFSKRLDLRQETIFSIDPETARDLDDALSIKKIDHDLYEVGVHISDVSYFLDEGTPLDERVSDRATTIYLVDRVNHMLPVKLCLLCSLLPGEDKLAFSVIWKMNGQGTILSTKFCRTLIHSCAQLSYGHAQSIIEGKEEVDLPELYNGKTCEDIRECILALHSISKHLTAGRFAGGALRIDQPKVAFSLDNDQLPYDFHLYEMRESNRLIEEFMLLANRSVAEFINDKYHSIALLRRHPPPKEELICSLKESLSKLGIFVDTSTAGAFHSSLQKNIQDDHGRAIVLNCLCSKVMNRALYFCNEDDTHHYSLSIDLYTHFTSPIRRYVDVVVHRILAASLGYAPLPDWTTETIRNFAKHSNQKKYAAKRAGEASTNLYTVLYIKKVDNMKTNAIVFNINNNSFDTIVVSLAFKIRVSIDGLKNVKVKHIDRDIASLMQIEWCKYGHTQVIQMFSEVRLLLTMNETNQQIEAQLLPPIL